MLHIKFIIRAGDRAQFLLFQKNLMTGEWFLAGLAGV